MKQKNDVAALDADAFGELVEPRTMRFERLLPGPIDRVWLYLTDPDKRALWFAGGPMELRVGGVAELHFDHSRITSESPPAEFDCEDKMISVGHVTVCEPPHRLSYTWWEDEGDQSEISFVLAEENDSVRLTLTHRRLRDRDFVLSISGGWHAHLDVLEDRLNGVEPRAFWSNLMALKAMYVERLPLE